MIMQKTYTQSEAVSLVLKIEKCRERGERVFKACQQVGVTDTTYYRWKEQFKYLLHKAGNDNTDRGAGPHGNPAVGLLRPTLRDV